MSEKKKKAIHGIHIRTVSYVMIFLSIMLYFVLLFVSHKVSKEYEVVVYATEDYIKCDKDAQELWEGSNYLTEQIQFYVMTGKSVYANAYFEEAYVTKRREFALSALKLHEVRPHTRHFLEEALASSNKLMEREIYAIKLTALSQGTDLREFPAIVQKVVLTDEDNALTPDEMLEKARGLIFGRDYHEAKVLIKNNINSFVNEAIANTYSDQQKSLSILNNFFTLSKVSFSILFLFNLIPFAMIILLIIRPLQRYTNSIKDEKELEIMGSYEFKYLAQIYNDIHELKASHEALLRQRAEHDALTGLINRGAFERIKQLFTMNPVALALLIIDVDEFKFINDHYGHEMGDQILRKIARVIKESFRVKDYPARIGGDEFAVILVDVTVAEKDVIQRKVNNMNIMLQRTTDGLPPVSLSVGGAFSNRGFIEELYVYADRALYVVKENGRCGCCFYEDLDKYKDNSK